MTKQSECEHRSRRSDVRWVIVIDGVWVIRYGVHTNVPHLAKSFPTRKRARDYAKMGYAGRAWHVRPRVKAPSITIS